MICEKCGREYPDDMPKCLWCDHAPTVLPEPEIEEVEEDEIELDADGNPVPHPAGNYMWSAAFGGPIIAWVFHRKELRRSEHSFFWYLVAYNLCFGFADRLLGKALEHVDLGILSFAFSLAWLVLWVVVMGRLGAKRIKYAFPHYKTALYKKREKWATIVGVSIFSLSYLGAFVYGIVKGLAQMGAI
ncbi:hypothetical protein [Fibrobacter sp.]|uniref:hypothetical protein n=1 Tax=Fibrobacter sp. TaxID=35828 RepID=UPI00388FFDA1